MAELMEGAVQQAPQCGRHSTARMLSLPSPQVMACAVDVQTIQTRIILDGVAMAKSAVFGAMHLGIAFGVSYALTGSVSIAGAITIVEPVVNTVAHYFFDRWWDARPRAQPAGAGS
jgi:uncharacterized membrane protein